MNWHFALYRSVHGKHGACFIGYLCTSISAPFIGVDEIYLWMISLFDLCESCDKWGGGGGAAMSILQAIIVLYFTLDI